MRSRAPLALIEQAAMLLVFSLAAVLCLRAFVWADSESQSSAARDRAVLEAQNAAEIIKSCKGDISAAAEIYGGIHKEGCWTINYDENWNETGANAVYFLSVTIQESEAEYLGKAEIGVFREEVDLVCFEVYWQEVGRGE